MVSHVPGAPLGTVRHRPASLLTDFGSAIAQLGCALADFDHPAIHRDFYWDLANARRSIDEYRPLIEDRKLGDAIDTIVDRFDVHVRPSLPSFRAERSTTISTTTTFSSAAASRAATTCT